MRRRILIFLALLPAILDLLPGEIRPDGWFGILWRGYTLTALLVVLIVLSLWGLRVFLWRVGRRLAFSYFLIGVLPAPLILLMLLVAGYIGSGFLFSHLYCDAVREVESDLRHAAALHVAELSRGQVRGSPTPIPILYIYYRDGRKLAGPREAPSAWQPWWENHSDPTDDTGLRSPLVAGVDGSPTVMTASRRGRYGLVAIYGGDLEEELSRRSGLWVELDRFDEKEEEAFYTFSLWRRNYPVKFLHRDAFLMDEARSDEDSRKLAEFFYPDQEAPGLLERPLILWGEISSPFRDLDGRQSAPLVYASLTGNLRAVGNALVSRSAEIDVSAFVILLTLVFVLAHIWLAAALMAVWMIFNLTRAVNTLYHATQKVRRGDFSTRIDVRRRDQIGDLQSSFNQMTANLETLVASAAQKEALEKELTIAREVQESLLPGRELGGRDLRFAAHFVPSAAIGGDYYDVLPFGSTQGPPPPEHERPLAVVVADVSGHGLSAGLRMAMVKSALQLLCEQDRPPASILAGLHRLQRSRGDRGFVTATLARIDRQTRTMTISNAGHPPVYLIRGGDVEEIVVRGTPLGALGSDFGREEVALEPGDTVVWLSDGLIEAVDADDEPFGYRRLREVLAQGAGDAEEVRDRLLAAVAAHTGGRDPEDDQTLLVMVYEPEDETNDDQTS